MGITSKLHKSTAQQQKQQLKRTKVSTSKNMKAMFLCAMLALIEPSQARHHYGHHISGHKPYRTHQRAPMPPTTPRPTATPCRGEWNIGTGSNGGLHKISFDGKLGTITTHCCYKDMECDIQGVSAEHGNHKIKCSGGHPGYHWWSSDVPPQCTVDGGRNQNAAVEDKWGEHWVTLT